MTIVAGSRSEGTVTSMNSSAGAVRSRVMRADGVQDPLDPAENVQRSTSLELGAWCFELALGLVHGEPPLPIADARGDHEPHFVLVLRARTVLKLEDEDEDEGRARLGSWRGLGRVDTGSRDEVDDEEQGVKQRAKDDALADG